MCCLGSESGRIKVHGESSGAVFAQCFFSILGGLSYWSMMGLSSGMRTSPGFALFQVSLHRCLKSSGFSFCVREWWNLFWCSRAVLCHLTALLCYCWVLENTGGWRVGPFSWREGKLQVHGRQVSCSLSTWIRGVGKRNEILAQGHVRGSW